MLCSAILLGLHSQASEPLITSVLVEDGTISLSWDTATNRFVVELFTNLNDVSTCLASSSGATTQVVSFILPQARYGYFRLHHGLEVVHFPDPLLEQKVREAIINKIHPENQIYDADLENISPYPSWSCITNLSGMEHMVTLTDLYLHNTCVTDITPLASLTNLVSADLHYNSIVDISALSNMVWLTHLTLYNNSIVNIAPISSLVNLQYLLVGNNNITDITALSGLTNLSSLWLNDNHISDISPLITNAINGGIGTGTWVRLDGNVLTDPNQVTVLRDFGVEVSYPTYP